MKLSGGGGDGGGGPESAGGSKGVGGMKGSVVAAFLLISTVTGLAGGTIAIGGDWMREMPYTSKQQSTPSLIMKSGWVPSTGSQQGNADRLAGNRVTQLHWHMRWERTHKGAIFGNCQLTMRDKPAASHVRFHD